MSPSNAFSSISTPMGELHVHVRTDGVLLKAEDEECVLHVQALNDVRIEGGYRLVFYLNPTRTIRQLYVECRWAALPTLHRGIPETGPGINALRWRTDGTTLLMATEDVEALRKRESFSAKIRRDLAEFPPALDHLIFGYKDDGLSIRLTELVKGELISLQFMIVWNTIPESPSGGSWSFISLEPWGLFD